MQRQWLGHLLGHGRSGVTWQLTLAPEHSELRFQPSCDREPAAAIVVPFGDVVAVGTVVADSGSNRSRRDRCLRICRYPRREKGRYVAVRKRQKAPLLFRLARNPDRTDVDDDQAPLAELLLSCRAALSVSTVDGVSDSVRLETGQKPFLIIANPHSGRGKAISLFRARVEPLLREANCPYQLVETQYAGHARSLIRECRDLRAHRALVALGGDGIFHEVLNGLADRQGNDEAPPLACLPSGSGNALAASIAFANGDRVSRASLASFLTTAAFNLLKSRPWPMDLVRVEFLGQPAASLVSFLAPVNFGFLAAIDRESERYRRCLGGARFAFDFVARLASPRPLPAWPARLSYLPVTCAAAAAAASDGAGAATAGGDLGLGAISSRRFLPDGRAPLPPGVGWVTVDASFLFVLVALQSHMAADMHYLPGCGLRDGQLWVTWVESGTVGRADLARIFLGLESGRHLEFAAFRREPAWAFRLEPAASGAGGWMGVDGEPVDCRPVQGEVAPGAGRLLAPV